MTSSLSYLLWKRVDVVCCDEESTTVTGELRCADNNGVIVAHCSGTAKREDGSAIETLVFIPLRQIFAIEETPQ